MKFNTYLCCKYGFKFSHFEICFFQFLQYTEHMSSLSIPAIPLFIQGDNNMYRHYIIHKIIYEKSFYCQFTGKYSQKFNLFI